MASGRGSVYEPSKLAWLAVSGPLAALPLLAFATGARRLPLATLRLLQYLGPTIQPAIGVFLLGEPFGGTRIAGFAPIWVGLRLYS